MKKRGVWLILGLLAAGLAGRAQQAQEPAAPEIPSPVEEKKLSFSVEAGNRWVQDVRGSSDVYRSVVNLGEGPRLFGAQAQYVDPGGKYADRIDIHGYSWGGDPYNTARFSAEKKGLYSLDFDYRNVAYFNSLPSFANPLLGEGVLLSQRTFDIERRQADAELRIKPGARISPFVAYTFADGLGRGVTTFVSDGNEFPVATDLDDSMNSLRGGVRLNFSRYHFTLEQGYTSFDDAQTVSTADSNRGNRRAPLFGRDLVLDQLLQTYRAEGDGMFQRAVVQGRPWSKLNFTGQFLYSRPSIEVTYDHQANGSLFLLQTVSPYNSVLEQSVGDAKRPRSSGNWSTEFQPHARLRIIQSWLTDRFHVAGGSLLNQSFDTAPETEIEQRSATLLVLNYNQHQIDVLFDVNRMLTLRGGHRYVWGDAEPTPPSLQLSPAAAEVRRHVGLAGAHLRAGSKLSFTLDFEASPGGRTFFRTGLMEYQKAKLRGRYRLTSTLTLNGSFAILDNQNTEPGVDFDFQSRQTSLSLAWVPAGNRFQILADYTRATLRSDIPIAVPPFYDARSAAYRDNGHHGGVYADLNLGRGVRIGVGGSFSVISGSQPTSYYQPQGRLAVPVYNKLSWTSEWRWYGFTERTLSDENFRTHIFSTGFRLEL
jgi:hypothetical protein